MARGFICGEEMHEAFIRLEKLHCRSGLEVSGELTWPGLARCWQMDNDSYYYEVVFPHRGFPQEIIVSYDVACLIYFFSHIIIYVRLTLTTGIRASIEDPQDKDL